MRILLTPKDVLKDFIERSIQADAVIVDTETTGLLNPGICEIALIDLSGRTLLNTLVKPRTPMTKEAQQIHGLSESELEDAPPMEDVYLSNQELFGRPMIAWNWVFDRNAILGSLLPWMKTLPEAAHSKYVQPQGECLMNLYSALYGEYCDIRQARKRVRLENAAKKYNAKIQQSHRALDDCLMLRDVFRAVRRELTDYQVQEVAEVKSTSVR